MQASFFYFSAFYIYPSKLPMCLYNLNFDENEYFIIVKNNVTCHSDWIGSLHHFPTLSGYILVSTALETDCSWEWDSNLRLATDDYLSWDSNPNHSREGRAVAKTETLTTQPQSSFFYSCFKYLTFIIVSFLS